MGKRENGVGSRFHDGGKRNRRRARKTTPDPVFPPFSPAIYPLTAKVPRAILKPPKVYFYDNGDTDDGAGMRLENLVATTLLKRLNFLEDYEGRRCSLHYIRDKDGREVDFATVIDGKVIELIKVKVADANLSTSLCYYAERLQPQRAVQIVRDLRRPFDSRGIRVTNPLDYFAKAR